MGMFDPAPEPPTELGRYRVLSTTAGIRVSPLQLGGMSIGDAWTGFMGSMSKEQSFKLLDAFFERGGNFIDTANEYQDEQSEEWIGEWMQMRGNRDRIVLATKFTSAYRDHAVGQGKGVNYSGNHKRSMHMSLRDSLRKLQTDYVDILYLHWWDWTTSVEEVMDSLHLLVEQGKVMYLGISDTPAYIVSACNTYAKMAHKTPFSIYQGRWSVMIRDMEREVIPMCRHFGMAIAPWDVLGGGKFQSKRSIEERKKNNETLRSWDGPDQTEDEKKISEALDEVAKQHGLDSLTTIALAYVMSKAPYVFPIIGGRKIEHLDDNIKSLSIKLTAEQIAYLEKVIAFEPGFPQNFVGEDPAVSGRTTELLDSVAQYSWVRRPKAIGYE